MYDELVKALRDMSKMGMKYGMAVVKMREAADAIEELNCNYQLALGSMKKEYKCCQNGTRPSWCPLVPVPPHGRLIDADALVDSFDPSDFWNPDAEDNCFAAIHVVNCAPTIIEAELPVHHGTFAATSEQEALKRIIPAEEGEI